MRTKQSLKNLYDEKDKTDSEFVYLRMRTKEETELIVTDYISGSNEYILVTIQKCKFKDEASDEEGEKAE